MSDRISRTPGIGSAYPVKPVQPARQRSGRKDPHDGRRNAPEDGVDEKDTPETGDRKRPTTIDEYI